MQERDHPSAMMGKPIHSNVLDDAPEPPLVKTVTDDEDDQSSTQGSETYSSVESYLRGYDLMVRQQGDEKDATLCYLKPLLELLENISKGTETVHRSNESYMFDDTICLVKEFSFSDLKKAVSAIEKDGNYRFMRMDLQWMMVLKLLTDNNPAENENISWAEIVQCYKVCIIGMQTLEDVPTPKHIRQRLRERSMLMLSLFRPSANNTILNAEARNHSMKSAGLTTETALPEGSAKRSVTTTGLPWLFQLVASFFLGVLLMRVSTTSVPTRAEKATNIQPTQTGRRIGDFTEMPMTQGPIVPPFPVDDATNSMPMGPAPLAPSPRRS